jgi:hypothetical protein
VVVDIVPGSARPRNPTVHDFVDVIAIDKGLLMAAAIIFTEHLPVIIIIVERRFIRNRVYLSYPSAQAIVGKFSYCVAVGVEDLHDPVVIIMVVLLALTIDLCVLLPLI